MIGEAPESLRQEKIEEIEELFKRQEKMEEIEELLKQKRANSHPKTPIRSLRMRRITIRQRFGGRAEFAWIFDRNLT